MSQYTDSLEALVTKSYGCKASHVESAPVREYFEGKPVWEGNVEVYALEGHPEASKAYAWSFDDDGKAQHITVLGKPPVDSPLRAVQIYISGLSR